MASAGRRAATQRGSGTRSRSPRARCRRSRARSGADGSARERRPARPPRLRATSLVELRVDRTRGSLGDPGHAFQFLLRRGQKPLGGAEVAEERPAPRGPDSLERVEDRLARLRVAPLAVEADREPVGLVADALQELQPGGVVPQQDRLRPPGTNTSSIRFAREITATRGRSYACIACSAAASWPLPPSITTRFGTAE